jgi:hypothetical protein
MRGGVLIMLDDLGEAIGKGARDRERVAEILANDGLAD